MKHLTPGIVTAVSMLLVLLDRTGPQNEETTLGLAQRSSLRAGALPFRSGLAVGEALGLFSRGEHGLLGLTPQGQHLRGLLGDGPEPTAEFRELIACLALADSAVGVLGRGLEIEQHSLRPRRADAELLLSWLDNFGLTQRTGDGWELVGLARLLAIGPLSTPLDLIPDVREEVGDLGEMLSLRYQEECLGIGHKTLQVSRLSPSFGFDILSQTGCHPSTEMIAIEVKASRAAGILSLHVTRHEAIVARSLGARYWLHAWGEIDCSEPLDRQYTRLRRRGYPLVITDVATAIGNCLGSLLTPTKSKKGWPVVVTEFRWEVPVPGGNALPLPEGGHGTGHHR